MSKMRKVNKKKERHGKVDKDTGLIIKYMQLSILVMTQDFYLFFVKLRVNNIVIYSYILIESPLTYGLHNWKWPSDF